MRAAGVIEFGGPEALQIVDVEPEPLGPGQVRLTVEAAAISPTDTHARSGAYAGRDPVTTPPWVPGMDVAGHEDDPFEVFAFRESGAAEVWATRR